MNTRTTILLFLAVAAVGIYIQFGERHYDNLDQRKAEARLALKFEPESIVGLRIETPAGIIVLEATGQVWRIVSPVQGMADANNVLRILDTLSGLRRSEIITLEEQKELKLTPEMYGFTPARANITLNDGVKQTSIMIGRDAPGGQQLYMKRSDMDDILVTSRDVLATLPDTVLDLRDRRLFNSQPGRIRRMEIQTKDKAFSAFRNDEDQWNIERPVFARGANGAIRQWLDHLYEYRIQDFVADSMAAASLYGFDEPTVQISLTTDNRSAPQVLKIGRPADINNTTYYASLLGQEAVFTITSDVVDWLTKDTAEFRDNRAMAIPVVNITYIQMSDGEHSLQLSRNTQDVWEVTSPKRFFADDQKVQQLLSAWSGAKAYAFIDPPVPDPTVFGIDNSQRSIQFAKTPRPAALASSAASTNPVANGYSDEEITLVIGSTNASGKLYTSPIGQPYVMELSGSLLTTFTVNPLEFRDHLVLAVDASSIRRISQRTGAQEQTVERTNIVFRSTATQEMPDNEAVDHILNALSHLVAFHYIEEDPRDLSVFGLDHPLRQITIGLSGTTGINKVLLIGNASSESDTFAMLQGTDVIFTLANEIVDVLMKPVTTSILPATVSPTFPEQE